MAKDTFYFSHDYNARQDDKIKRLIRKHGMAGYGIFWAIVEDLYNNANALRLDCEGMAFEYRVGEDMIESIINDFDLFVIDVDTFGSRSIESRLNERNEKSKKAKQSANDRWEKVRLAKKSNANALQPQSDGTAIKERKGKEKNETKESKGKIVAKMPLPEFTPCVEFWLKEFHIGWTFSGQSGKHLNSIIKKLRKILADKETESPPEKVILLFKNMCLKLPDWYKEKDLAIIDQKFNEIISEIQNGQKGISKKIGKSNVADIAKVFDGLKNAPTAEEIRSRGFGFER